MRIVVFTAALWSMCLGIPGADLSPADTNPYIRVTQVIKDGTLRISAKNISHKPIVAYVVAFEDGGQTMHLISGDTLQRQITAKKSQLTKWLQDPAVSNEEIVKRLFLAALVRPPDDREISLVVTSIGTRGPEVRRQVFEDTLWALFNAKEFIYNR